MAAPEQAPTMFNDYLGHDQDGGVVFNEPAIQNLVQEVLRGVPARQLKIARRAFVERLEAELTLQSSALSANELKINDPIKWQQLQAERRETT